MGFCFTSLQKKVAEYWPDFQGLDSGLATQALRQLKLDGQSQKDNVKTALNAVLGGVWHEARVHAEFGVGDLCVRCSEAVEDLEHIVHHCPAWAAEKREVELPAFALKVPPCVKLRGLLPAPKMQVVIKHEPVRNCVFVLNNGSADYGTVSTTSALNPCPKLLRLLRQLRFRLLRSGLGLTC
eukprot:5069779-Amphidinium_carterae.1